MKTKYLILLILSLSLLAVGCQNRHPENVQAAEKRWNAARSRIAVDLALRQFESRQYDKALQSLTPIFESDPEYAPAYLMQGQIYLDQDRLAEALAAFETCLQYDSQNAPACYNIALVYQRWNETAAAADYYQQAWEIKPNHVPYLLALAETLIQQQKQDYALDILRSHIENQTPNASVLMLAGHILQTRGDTVAAINMYQAASRVDADNLEISQTLALALYETGQYRAALKLFNKIDNDPLAQESWPSRLAAGRCCMQLSQFHAAQRCFQLVAEHDPDNPALWTLLAQTALARDDLDHARTWVDRSLSIDQHDNESLMLSGYIALMQSDYARAELDLRQMIDTAGDNPLALCLLARTLQARGQAQQAQQLYSKAQSLNPGDPLTSRFLADIP